jgi:hypothetical protein
MPICRNSDLVLKKNPRLIIWMRKNTIQIFILPHLSDVLKSWKEWLSRTSKKKAMLIINIGGVREKIWRQERLRVTCYQSGDSPMKNKEKRMSPVFVGTQDIQTSLPSPWDPIISKNKEWDLSVFTHLKTPHTQNIPIHVRLESCVLISTPHPHLSLLSVSMTVIKIIFSFYI